MKTKSLIMGFIVPFIVFWLTIVLLQVGFMFSGPKGASIFLVGTIAAALSLYISFHLASKYREKFSKSSLLTGNVITFILWIVGIFFAF